MAFGPVERARARWRALPSETRFSGSVIGVCGLAALVLSVWFIRANIAAPFRVPKSTLTANRIVFTSSNEAREAEAQKSRDTDRDGLSDYAELNLYRTSPYLADTDSDGVPDAIEIAQGTDPNCPTGQNCAGIANADLQPSIVSTTTNSDLRNVTQVRPVSEANQPTTAAAATQAFILNAPDPSTINATQAKALLTQSGLIAPESLATLNEAGIMQIYRGTYAQILSIREGLKNPIK